MIVVVWMMYVQVGTSTLIWYVATGSEVADTEGSTATGSPLKKIGNGRSAFPCVPSHNNKYGSKGVRRGMSDNKWKIKLNGDFIRNNSGFRLDSTLGVSAVL